MNSDRETKHLGEVRSHLLGVDACGCVFGQPGLVRRCMPSLIGFRDRSDAVVFARANGGSIRTYDQLLDQAYN